MEELLRSDRLIDPKNETLSDLEDPEIFHISKIRGAQKGFRVTCRQLQLAYNTPMMQQYSCDYIEMIRALKTEEELNATVGGLPMLSDMIAELIKLRRSKEMQMAKLYADSIKPQVANNPPIFMPQEAEKEGMFAKILNFFLGKKKPEGGSGSR
jgi:hypothetical protein